MEAIERSSAGLAVPVSRGPLLHDLLGLVNLEAGQFEMIDHAPCELRPRIVGDVLFQHPAQEIAALAEGESDRERKQIAERSVIHGRPCSLFVVVMLAGLPAGVNWARMSRIVA